MRESRGGSGQVEGRSASISWVSSSSESAWVEARRPLLSLGLFENDERTAVEG